MFWVTPPELQGQMVEVSYAADGAGLVWRRSYDRSDRTTTYEVADAEDCGCEDECDCFDPANAEPEGFDWKPSPNGPRD